MQPDTAEEWDYERNGNLTPSDIVAGSAKRVWWKCQKRGGETAKPASQAKDRKGSCPYLRREKTGKGGKRPCIPVPGGGTRLSAGAEWRHTCGMKRIVKYGTKVIRKRHVCGHEWKNDVYNRTRAPKPSGCVKCQRRTASGRFDRWRLKDGALADTNPNFAAGVDYEKNGNLTPIGYCGLTQNGTSLAFLAEAVMSYMSSGSKGAAVHGPGARSEGRKRGKKVFVAETRTVYENHQRCWNTSRKHPSP